jgi:hypothetical protein
MANFDPSTQDPADKTPAPLATRANWMSSLWRHFDDDRIVNPFGAIPLNQLPIPGSHDSGTSLMTRAAKTQGLTVAQQLEQGIRFFDLRPKVNHDVFKVHHGSTGLSEEGALLAQCDPDGKPVFDPNIDCIFNDIRKFLIVNPDEIIILKFQSFGAATSQSFTPLDHRNFRTLMADYMPLIAPRPVSDLTLNNLYAQSGRVIVFYGDDLEAQDATWDPIWPFASGSDQREGGYRLECFDPWWRDDIGSFGGDDKDEEFEGRWLPYHIQNLKDWQADGLAGFFVTQAQMEIQPGATLDSCEDSARKNNPRNIEAFTDWMKNGVPKAAGTLRPNILTLDYIEYGSLCDEIVDYFTSLTPATLPEAYPYHQFDLVTVRSALNRVRADDLTTTLNIAHPGKGYHLLTTHQDQWVPQKAVCLVHKTPAPGTVAVYREFPIGKPHGKSFYSTRGAERANASGWELGEVVFYAYATQAPGTVPIYADTPISNLWACFAYTDRPTPAVGWKRNEVAFYAYPAASERAVVYVYEFRTPGYYRFSLDRNLAYDTGWTLRGSEFRALRKGVDGSKSVFEEIPKAGSLPGKPRYNYSRETAEQADKRDWKQEGVAFGAHGNPGVDPGAVPVYLETIIKPKWGRLYFSPRPASELPPGWELGDKVFYGYPYRYS